MTTTTTTQILNLQENQGFCGYYIAHEYDHGTTTFYNNQPPHNHNRRKENDGKQRFQYPGAG